MGLLGAMFLVGIVVGCSTLTRLGDIKGRKPIYILGILIHLVFMSAVFFVTNEWIAYFAVFLFGLSISSRYYVGYTYNVEM